MSSLVTDTKPLATRRPTAVSDDLSLTIPPTTQTGLQSAGKRAIDVVVSLLGLALFAPIFLLIAIAILVETGRPLFFVQSRLGEGGRRFKVYKFRSMSKDAESRFEEVKALNQVKDGPIFKARVDPRVTRVGRMLRRTSLDEMPQLLNVLKGEMSLVGPRPPLESEVRQYAEWQLRRLSVKPGMTGLWQVSGRSNLSFSEMVTLDIEYIEKWSLIADVVLLARTPMAVLISRGAY